jgi:hypothetical protein
MNTKPHFVIAAFAAIATLLSNCREGGDSAAPTPSTSHKASSDMEKKALGLLKATFRFTGDSVVCKPKGGRIEQLKPWRLEWEEMQVTEADKLNGVTERLVFSCVADARRFFSSGSKEWSRWETTTEDTRLVSLGMLERDKGELRVVPKDEVVRHMAINMGGNEMTPFALALGMQYVLRSWPGEAVPLDDSVVQEALSRQ